MVLADGYLHEDMGAIVDKCTNVHAELRGHKNVYADIISCADTSQPHT